MMLLVAQQFWETFRALATAPEAPMVDIILLLTNGEELGSLGLDSFMNSSPWAQDVGFFLQMDQSGSRGHALAVFGDSQSGVGGLFSARNVGVPLWVYTTSFVVKMT